MTTAGHHHKAAFCIKDKCMFSDLIIKLTRSIQVVTDLSRFVDEKWFQSVFHQTAFKMPGKRMRYDDRNTGLHFYKGIQTAGVITMFVREYEIVYPTSINTCFLKICFKYFRFCTCVKQDGLFQSIN